MSTDTGAGPSQGGGYQPRYQGGGPGGGQFGELSMPQQRVKRVVDHSAPASRYLKDRIFRPEARRSASAVDSAAGASAVDMGLPAASLVNASTSLCTRFVHSAWCKDRCPVNVVCWTPEGRRLIAGGNNGMFTLWEGVNFQHLPSMQSHDSAVRAMVWNSAGEWLISADNSGFVKYWQPTFNNVKEFEAHPGAPVRELSFCPTDAKFVSCSDDATVKIWDFERGALERLLPGADQIEGKSHGWDVKTVQWHPELSLIASGSKDNCTKFWDPRAAREACTLHLHKNTVSVLRWHPKGNHLLTGARDQLVKLFDIRTMREAGAFKAHKREVTSLAWHPVHAELFASGANDGSLYYWSTLREAAPMGEALGARDFTAHQQAVWSLAWHPLGHLLVSGSNDTFVKFWSRARPGDRTKREREDADEEFDESEMRLQHLNQ